MTSNNLFVDNIDLRSSSLRSSTAFILLPIFHLVIRTPKQRLSRLGDYLALVGGIFAFLSSMYGGIEGMLNSKEISS